MRKDEVKNVSKDLTGVIGRDYLKHIGESTENPSNPTSQFTNYTVLGMLGSALATAWMRDGGLHEAIWGVEPP